MKTLLEKLRIDAEVLVFWLASGDLNTYQLIINGESNDIDWDIIVNESLKYEAWWDELQRFRGRSVDLSSSQEINRLAQIIDTVPGRHGMYNPHDGKDTDRRRLSLAAMTELPRKPAINILSKMGVNMGMHTQHLHEDVLQESSSDEAFYSYDDEVTSEEEMEYDMEERPRASTAPSSDPAKKPLFSVTEPPKRRRHRKLGSEGLFSPAGKEDGQKGAETRAAGAVSYGTMSTSQTLGGDQEHTVPTLMPAPLQASEFTGEGLKASKDTRQRRIEARPSLRPLKADQILHSGIRRARSMSPLRTSEAPSLLGDGGSTPARPAMSRKGSGIKFSSRPMPETKVTSEAEGSTIGFSHDNYNPETPRVERPTFSRQSSYGKFSSRPVPETRLTGSGDGSRTITFVEQPTWYPQSTPHSRNHSRQGSSYSNFGQSQGELSVGIPELLEGYNCRETSDEQDTIGGAAYSTQAVSLSFNDLPSRAQHLILNELMRRNSTETAVLMTTLPIPSEGTSLDDVATVQYLSDVELLCNELPPTLMVLSNNMTVTVSL